MRARLVTCLSIFAVMALSNAIVPVLPAYGEGSTEQGVIYAAYFFGAFALTLPAGILSDRYGKVAVMRSGLCVTVLSGGILCCVTDLSLVIAARLLEGFGAGLFVAAAMAYVNSVPEHETMSGYYMASLNTGLVLGLVISGFLAVHIPGVSGITVFAGACLLAALTSFSLSEIPPVHRKPDPGSILTGLIVDYGWFWYSAIVLIGITGVVTSLYPEFSPSGSDIDSIWIAGMSVVTILTTLIVSRMDLPPIRTIRASALIMAAGVLLTMYNPAGFLIIGMAAGIVLIAQMAFLADASVCQGAAMGLFSTTSYLGMGLLPSASGILAESFGYFATFCIFAGTAFSVALTIGLCSCRVDPAMPDSV